jgi:trehalose-6-phosphate synthase
MLGIKSRTRQGGLLALQVDEREVIVTMNHVSIEPLLLQRALEDPRTLELAKNLREKYRGKKIIVSVDNCQRLSGGSLRMTAFEKLLEDQRIDRGNQQGNSVNSRSKTSLSAIDTVQTQLPFNAGAAGDSSNSTSSSSSSSSSSGRLSDLGSNGGPSPCKVVLIQRIIRTSARQDDENATSAELKEMVQSINSKYDSAVDYQEVKLLPLADRVALWLAADVMLLTTIREGLNLMPMEYIFARKNLEHAGVVVVSEFSVCSSLLNGALKINPFFALSVADTLDKALNMDSNECARRRQRDIGFVSNRPSSSWTKQILIDLFSLKEIMNNKTRNKASSLNNLPKYVHFPTLSSAYKAAGTSGISSPCKRVFIFDYGGTLLHKEKYDIYIKQTLSAISGRKPSGGMMEVIKALSEDPANAVMV